LARISDLQGRVRNAANGKYISNIAIGKKIDASSPSFVSAFVWAFVLEAFDKVGVVAEDLSKILRSTIISNSVTAHPTNPYSTDYTVQSMELDRILAEENLPKKSAKLRNQIAKMIAMSPVVDVEAKNKGKKTQEDEVVEAMSYMRLS